MSSASGPGVMPQGTGNDTNRPGQPVPTIADLRALSHEQALQLIESSPYFDLAWYCEHNPDVVLHGVRPAKHYLQFGAREWRAPGPLFCTAWYKLVYADIANTDDVNPLIHYILIGARAGRLPAPPGLGVRATDDDVIEFIRQDGIFDEAWYRLMSSDLEGTGIAPIMHYLRWGAAEGRNPSRAFHTKTYVSFPGVKDSGLNPLLHYMLFGRAAGLDPRKPPSVDPATYALVRHSAHFDEQYYLDNNPDLWRTALDACEQFCESGYRELRKPSATFDLPWYRETYLPDRDDLNPLVHYETEGRQLGYLPRAPIADFSFTHEGMRYGTEQRKTLRRACLFAGFDPHGLVDDYVVAYVRELSRFADVYYLADGEMQVGELAKLAPFVQGAWALRHGAYDFGSYRMLASDLVGWHTLDAYDELMFVNDSCYCIRPLDEVFDKMDAAACDWWGLQATKGIWSTRHIDSNRFTQKISIDTVRDKLLNAFERDYTYDFLVASYFLVFRKPVLADHGFRAMVNRIKREPSKQLIVQKYEIGFTRRLIHAGHRFDTFIDHLYPLHPVYSLTHFELIRQGFPLLKRFLLTENHYMAPGLARWKELVLEAAPSADVSLVQANLDRVADQEKLFRSLNIRLDEQGRPSPPAVLSDSEFTTLDATKPKQDNWWVFPVCGFNHTLAGNERAVFEAVKNNPSIKKIILYRSKRVVIDGVNVEQAPLKSLLGQAYLIGSRVMFIKHTPTTNLVYPLAEDRHYLINLWHGIPLKRIGFASLDQQGNLERLGREHARCKAVIASSRVDRMAMASAFYPLQYNDVWVTGLPRNDFILRAADALPEDLQHEIATLQRALAGRRLVLYAPTFRNSQDNAYYQFSPEQLAALSCVLERHGAALGVREHLADTAHSYSSQLSPIGALSMGDNLYANIEVLYREAAVLLTDYSSCFFDFALTGRPMISFAYDRDRYEGNERGFFYHMDDVFPGPICQSFDTMLAALDTALVGDAGRHPNYDAVLRMFFEYVDDGSAERVVERVQELLAAGEIPSS